MFVSHLYAEIHFEQGVHDYQIKMYLSHAPNTTGVGRPDSEMLTYKPLINNAVVFFKSVKVFTKIN